MKSKRLPVITHTWSCAAIPAWVKKEVNSSCTFQPLCVECFWSVFLLSGDEWRCFTPRRGSLNSLVLFHFGVSESGAVWGKTSTCDVCKNECKVNADTCCHATLSNRWSFTGSDVPVSPSPHLKSPPTWSSLGCYESIIHSSAVARQNGRKMHHSCDTHTHSFTHGGLAVFQPIEPLLKVNPCLNPYWASAEGWSS